MTSPFVVEINKLKNLQINLEKSESILLEHLSKYENGSEIIEYQRELNSLRIKCLYPYEDELRDVFLQLNKIKSEVRAENLHCLDLNYLKKEMITLQNKIKNMRYTHKIMLEKLEKEEKALLEEMRIYEEKLAQWEKPVVIAYSNCGSVKSFENNSNICPEVREFLQFISESGGHENGWTLDGHNLFLKMRNKYRSPKVMAQCLHAMCPDLSIEEILKHEAWYKKYTELKIKQKEAIAKWRQNKNSSNKIITQEENKPKTNPQGKKENKVNKQEIQEKIIAWKKEKEKRNKQEEEARKYLEKQKKEQEEKKKVQQEELKMELTKRKDEKLKKMQEEKIKKELEELKEREFRILNAKRLIKHFRSQDDTYIMKMKHSRMKKRSKSLEKPVVKKNLVPRDPERLLQPTEQWFYRILAKKHEERNDENSNSVCNVKTVQKLGRPQWRKNL